MTITATGAEIAAFAVWAGVGLGLGIMAALGAAKILFHTLLWCVEEIPWYAYRLRKWTASKWRG